MSKIAEAIELYRQGCACSQAILAVYGPELGLDRATAMRIAAGFAGGMRMGETCGAVTGAFMVLGLHRGTADCVTPAGREAVVASVKEFVARFRRRNGSVVCKELLGCDVSTPEGIKQARERELFRTLCPEMVQAAAEILEGLMAESQLSGAADR
jgi:C_GCAxxG_C_C family probable redox protein